VKAVNGATHFHKDYVEAAKTLTKHVVLVVGSFKLTPRPVIFAILDFQEMLCR